MYVWASQ